MNIRIRITALVLALFTLFCAHALAGEFVPALPEDTSCDLIVAGNYSNFEALEAEADRFTALYPEVTVEYVNLDDYNNTIGLALLGEDAPDVYVIMPWMVGRADHQRLFDAAENLADPALQIDLSFYREGLLHRDETGAVPMAPIFSTTYGMLVNETLFEREGLSVPETWEEWISCCQSLREKGYESPVMGYNRQGSGTMFYTLAYPFLALSLKDDPQAARRLNDLEAGAGAALLPALSLVRDFVSAGCADPEKCAAEIENNYGAVILRFFEGDVPMMLCLADTVSGTAKRESLSEAFLASPFTYRFYPCPVDAEGGVFLDIASLEFALNKNSEKADMAREFMRFLLREETINEMAEIKRLTTPAKNLSFDGVFAAFGQIPEHRTVNGEELGILDLVTVRLRSAFYQVGNGQLTPEEAAERFAALAD